MLCHAPLNRFFPQPNVHQLVHTGVCYQCRHDDASGCHLAHNNSAEAHLNSCMPEANMYHACHLVVFMHMDQPHIFDLASKVVGHSHACTSSASSAEVAVCIIIRFEHGQTSASHDCDKTALRTGCHLLTAHMLYYKSCCMSRGPGLDVSKNTKFGHPNC